MTARLQHIQHNKINNTQSQKPCTAADRHPLSALLHPENLQKRTRHLPGCIGNQFGRDPDTYSFKEPPSNKETPLFRSNFWEDNL